MVERVLGKTGAPIKAQAMIYMAVVQAVLLYGSEIWAFTDAMMMVQEGFHHRISGRIAGMTAKRSNGGEWKWSSVETALEVTGIWPIRGYLHRWQ